MKYYELIILHQGERVRLIKYHLQSVLDAATALVVKHLGVDDPGAMAIEVYLVDKHGRHSLVVNIEA